MGYRFALHRSDLPGTPDIVLPARSSVIFVNGCFWHGHSGCCKSALPQTRRAYWTAKILRNKRRDQRTTRLLRNAGWHVITAWQCELRRPDRLANRLDRLLRGGLG